MGGSDVTNDDVVLFHYLWYEFCRGRRGAGRRFSDSAPLEVRIKLPSVGWIKTLITSGDIYWTAFAGVRTGSHTALRVSPLVRLLLGLPLLLRSRSAPRPPLSTYGTNFCRSTVVSGYHCFPNNGSYTFMREISGLARQITPLRLLLNPSPASSLYVLSTLISSHPWYQAFLGRTKATIFNRMGHFYEPRMQNYKVTY